MNLNLGGYMTQKLAKLSTGNKVKRDARRFGREGWVVPLSLPSPFAT